MDREGASFREIGRRLTEIGAKPHRGKAWYASSVREMLRSRMTAELLTDGLHNDPNDTLSSMA
jgi:hypothetical protein